MRAFTAPIVIDDFRGLVSNRGAFPSHPGEAKTQTNLRANRPGELSVRKEPEEITFTVGDPGATNWISLASYPSPAGETFVVAQTGSAGNYKVHAFQV